MSNFYFYLRQAVSNSVRNRQRTFFVLFCIAVGVAAVVSLRTVGLMIGDGLTSDLQADNRADLVITPPFVDDRFGESDVDETLIEKGGEFSGTTFSELAITRIQEWASEQGGEMQLAIRKQRPASVYIAGDEAADSVTAISFFVEPQSYPFYDTLEMSRPAGTPLAEALASRHHVVIGERLASALNVSVGDQLHVRGPEPFVVGGIVADTAEARLREMEAVVLPFLILPYEFAVHELDSLADTIYVKAERGAELAVLADDLEETFTGFNVSTTEDLREQNRELSDQLTKLITTLGLLSLLIGGIGIINTMLVVVGRRTLEISVLKTLGLQGRQITMMFLVEGLLLGIVGSALGVILGVGLVTVLQGVAERVFVQTLEFALYPEALSMGFVMGVLVTLVFGFLPTLAAGKVRPNVVLQPDRAGVPKAGRAVSVLVVVLLTAVIGLLVGHILGRFGLGMIIAFSAMLALGLLTLVFRGLVYLLAHLPSFSKISIKLTQRALADHSGRVASTLLALVVGMFALSSILLMTQTLLNLIEDVMANRLGGEVIAVPRSPEASRRIAGVIQGLEGVEAVQHQILYKAKIVAINGNRDVASLEEKAYAEAASLPADSDDESDSARSDGDATTDRFDRNRFILRDFLGQFSVVRIADVGDKEDDRYEIAEGSDLSDAKTRSVSADVLGEVVLRGGDASEWLGIGVGDTLTLAFESPTAGDTESQGDKGSPESLESRVTVVGMVAKPPKKKMQVNTGEKTRSIGTNDVVPSMAVASPTAFILDVADDEVHLAIRKLSGIPGVFALEVALINTILTRIFEKLSALPLVVAILSLFAAGVIIANSVSLAVLERRRQIGIMKAIGLQSGQVLRLLLLENGLVGLAGGIIGCAIGAAGILMMGVLSESPGSFPLATLLGLIALAVTVALVATLLTAWGASREKPLIVLRYE